MDDLRVEQVQEGSVPIDDSMPLSSASGTVLCGVMGRGHTVLHLVLMPSEELVLPLDDVFHGSTS